MALDRIVARVRERLGARMGERPLASLYEGLAPSDRSFDHAVRGPGPAFILEVKPRSPSLGALRPASAMRDVCASYARHATVVSVLTEPDYFGGSDELLRDIRCRVPQPVLAKDFIVDPWQVAHARYHGADAVLLMLAVLDDVTWARCAAMAAQLNMGILTEVHTADEMARAARLGARVIGINNRDLATLTVDVTTTERLARLAPAGVVLIAESGVDGRETFERLQPHVDGVLVGGSLMQAADVDGAVRRLVYGETKVCGLTRDDDARAALDAGATHGGLVFHPGSPRVVSHAQARHLVGAAALHWVGVFVHEDEHTIATAAHALGLAAVQLHGGATRADVRALRGRLPVGCEVWKAISVQGLLPAPGSTGADLVLLDGHAPGRYGGTGRTFDWDLVRRAHGYGPFAIAGGLNPSNVGAAARLGARLIDVSSGVESRPGVKDATLMHAFLQARRGGRRHALSSAPARERVA